MTSALRVLLLRARPQAEATAERLRVRGMTPVLSPLLDITFSPPPEPEIFDGVQAVLLTSGNGATALGHSAAPRDMRVFAVGDRTAALARKAGFAQVESASGTARDLAIKAQSSLSPAHGSLLHFHGATVGHSPLPSLRDAGFETRAHLAYRTNYRAEFSEGAARMLAAGKIDAVLLYSPKGASAFLTAYARLAPPPASAPILVVISEAAHTPLCANPAFADIRPAETPDEGAMLKILDKLSQNSVAGTSHRG